MRCMERNKQRFYYALFMGKVAGVDEYGNANGEYDYIFSEPIPFAANISAAKGEAQIEQFGANLAYDKVIVMDSSAPMIDEHSILWVDALPQSEGGKAMPHDYIVKKVARSLNQVAVAIGRVNAGG